MEIPPTKMDVMSNVSQNIVEIRLFKRTYERPVMMVIQLIVMDVLAHVFQKFVETILSKIGADT